jgi:hypothetical protein
MYQVPDRKRFPKSASWINPLHVQTAKANSRRAGQLTRVGSAGSLRHADWTGTPDEGTVP